MAVLMITAIIHATVQDKKAGMIINKSSLKTTQTNRLTNTTCLNNSSSLLLSSVQALILGFIS
jgi:hypothetical protein